MKTLLLNKGYKALIDDEDFSVVSKLGWYALKIRNKVYVAAMTYKSQERKLLLLHRFLLNPPPNLFVDHINLDTLDNRRSNLRLCTNRENLQNRGCTRKNQVGLKGVSMNSQRRNLSKPWRARIKTSEGKRSLSWILQNTARSKQCL